MKTAKDIQTQFQAQTITSGKANVFSCKVMINNQPICEGLGTTMESAEDTAFYATKICQGA